MVRVFATKFAKISHEIVHRTWQTHACVPLSARPTHASHSHDGTPPNFKSGFLHAYMKFRNPKLKISQATWQTRAYAHRNMTFTCITESRRYAAHVINNLKQNCRFPICTYATWTSCCAYKACIFYMCIRQQLDIHMMCDQTIQTKQFSLTHVQEACKFNHALRHARITGSNIFRNWTGRTCISDSTLRKQLMKTASLQLLIDFFQRLLWVSAVQPGLHAQHTSTVNLSAAIFRFSLSLSLSHIYTTEQKLAEQKTVCAWEREREEEDSEREQENAVCGVINVWLDCTHNPWDVEIFLCDTGRRKEFVLLWNPTGAQTHAWMLARL